MNGIGVVTGHSSITRKKSQRKRGLRYSFQHVMSCHAMPVNKPTKSLVHYHTSPCPGEPKKKHIMGN